MKITSETKPMLNSVAAKVRFRRKGLPGIDEIRKALMKVGIDPKELKAISLVQPGRFFVAMSHEKSVDTIIIELDD